MTTKRQHYSEACDWDTTHFKQYVLAQQLHEKKVNPFNHKLLSFEALFNFANLAEEKKAKFQKVYNNLVKNNWVFWDYNK